MKVVLRETKKPCGEGFMETQYEVGKFFKKHKFIKVQIEDFMFNIEEVHFLSYNEDSPLMLDEARNVLDLVPYDEEFNIISAYTVYDRAGLVVKYNHRKSLNLVCKMSIVPCSAKKCKKENKHD